MNEIVVIGSLNMDLIVQVKELPTPGETTAAYSFRTLPGGKGANQAVAVARLGAPVKMIGRVGADKYGEALLTNLNVNGVDVSNIALDSSVGTGVALIAVDSHGENTIMVFPGANGTCRQTDVEAVEDVIASARALILQLEIPLETVEAALVIADRHDRLTILNPAPARKLSRGLLALVDFLIVNEVEASVLSDYGVKDVRTASVAARILNENGPKHVIVTLGANGALFVGPEGEFHIPSFEVQAVDTTGAGDAFIGAFAFAYTQGMDVENCIRYACAAGAAATTRVGAQVSLPTRKEVEKILSLK